MSVDVGKIMAATSQEISDSQWFATQYFDFLKNIDAEKKSNEGPTIVMGSEIFFINDPSVVCYKIGKSSEDIPALQEILQTESTDPVQPAEKMPSAPPVEHRPSAVTASLTENTDQVMSQVLPPKNPTYDPYFMYALHLANELRKYDLRTLAIVKRSIANVLFEADMTLS